MGYNEATLSRVLDVLTYLGEKTNYASEPAQQPYPVPAIIRALQDTRHHSRQQARRAVDAAITLGVITRWKVSDASADQRIKHVGLTTMGLTILHEPKQPGTTHLFDIQANQ